VDNPATVTTYAMLFGTALLLPIALAEGMVPAVASLDWQLLGLVVFLGVLGGAAAFLLWTWALSRITPTQVAVHVNLNPIVAALLGIALLGERRSPMFVLGFAAVVIGVLLVNWPGPAGTEASVREARNVEGTWASSAGREAAHRAEPGGGPPTTPLPWVLGRRSLRPAARSGSAW
jgi:drug/metabolite transporter (DMT)-like permease